MAKPTQGTISTTTRSVAETERFAAELAVRLAGGECLALSGPMGAGKTHFVRGLLRGLNGNESAVHSPTFVLLNVYDSGRVKLFHLDAYRTNGSEELEAIGFGELLEQGGVVVIEWPERVASLLPVRHISIVIEPTGARSRRISVSWPNG
jgi:tRNA threonylcarbamoyladenosine biosynthesis protein TsaE